jgi:hypothetical protein
MSLVLPLVEERATHLLLALLYLFEKVQLAHLLEQILIFLLLLSYLLLLKLLLSLLVFQITQGLLMLFHLLNEETATEAARATVLTCTILDQESSK